jgi:4-carboxymuconolactone decarboxylase
MSKPDGPVSRVGIASESSDDPILAEIYARIRAHRGRILNIHQVAGLAPKLLRAQAAYATAMREETTLPRHLQELLILRIAQVNNSDYEQSVHRPIAIRCGVDPAKIAALASWRDSTLYDATERAALGYVEQAGRGGDVDDATFAVARRHFALQEIVELTALVAWYVGNSRFVRALQIAVEKEKS